MLAHHHFSPLPLRFPSNREKPQELHKLIDAKGTLLEAGYKAAAESRKTKADARGRAPPPPSGFGFERTLYVSLKLIFFILRTYNISLFSLRGSLLSLILLYIYFNVAVMFF